MTIQVETKIQAAGSPKAAGSPSSLTGSLSGRSATLLRTDDDFNDWFDAAETNTVQLTHTYSGSSTDSLNLQSSTSAPQSPAARIPLLTRSASVPVLLHQQSRGRVSNLTAVPVWQLRSSEQDYQRQILEDRLQKIGEHVTEFNVLAMLRLFVQFANRHPKQWHLNWTNPFARGIMQCLVTMYTKDLKPPQTDEKEIKSLLEIDVPCEDADRKECREVCVDTLITLKIPKAIAKLAAEYFSGSRPLGAAICTFSIATIDTKLPLNHEYFSGEIYPYRILFQKEPWKTFLKNNHPKYPDLIRSIKALREYLEKHAHDTSFFEHLDEDVDANDTSFFDHLANLIHGEARAIATTPQQIAASHLSSTTTQQQQQQQ